VADLSQPVASTAISAFGGPKNARAARINYDVPLPETFTFQCIHDLRLDAIDDIWTETAKKAGDDLSEAAGIEVNPRGIRVIDAARLQDFMERRLSSGPFNAPSPHLPKPGPGPDPAPRAARSPLRRDVPIIAIDGASIASNQVRNVTAETLARRVSRDVDTANSSSLPIVAIPVGTFLPHGSIRMVQVPRTAPRIWIVEEYEVVSFLGDFGLGRVVGATTLFPNEDLFLSSESWREDEEVFASASSIFDSFDTSSQDRFANSLEARAASAYSAETVGANYFSHTGEGHWGLIFGGHSETDAELNKLDYRSSSDQFSSAVSASLSEHASQANSRRETFISSGTMTAHKSGERSLSERRIHNPNLRRTLSFVFRELNQAYECCLVLRNLKVVFGNGRPGSLDSAELSSLLEFLNTYVKREHAIKVLVDIIETMAMAVDYSETSVTVLEMSLRDGQLGQWTDVQLDENGKLVFPSGTSAEHYVFRFKPRETLRTKLGDRTVPGLVRRTEGVVMRTGSVIAEALLGEADALDPYATALQDLDIEGRDLENSRTKLALSIIQSINDPAAQAKAYQAIFAPVNTLDVKLENLKTSP
jgi:hypothetical protein